MREKFFLRSQLQNRTNPILPKSHNSRAGILLGRSTWARKALRAYNILQDESVFLSDRRRNNLRKLLIPPNIVNNFPSCPINEIGKEIGEIWRKDLIRFSNVVKRNLRIEIRNRNREVQLTYNDLIVSESKKNSKLLRRILIPKESLGSPVAVETTNQLVTNPDDVKLVIQDYLKNLYSDSNPDASLHRPWLELEVWEFYRHEVQKILEESGPLTRKVTIEELEL